MAQDVRARAAGDQSARGQVAGTQSAGNQAAGNQAAGVPKAEKNHQPAAAAAVGLAEAAPGWSPAATGVIWSPPATSSACPKVTICICTYRRLAGLEALLEGLAGQRFERVAPPELDLVIVDNEGSAAVEALCRTVAHRAGLALTYVYEPHHGIPHARNACLDHLPAGSDFFAMIDDDEVPAADWLEQLLLVQARTAADVVRGPVTPVLAAGAPAWIRDFFGWPRRRGPMLANGPALADGPTLADGEPLDSASSNNVLVRAEAVRARGLRFDPTLRWTGGSDALFFRQLKFAGGHLVYAAAARVEETIPPERARLGYLWQLHYKQGANKFARKLQVKPSAPPRRVVKLVAKRTLRESLTLTTALFTLTTTLLHPKRHLAHTVPHLLRIAHAIGALAGMLGLQHHHYR